jgi:hypothetical protein
MKIPETEYPTLLEIISSTYTDKVEEIISAELDEDDNIVAFAIDKGDPDKYVFAKIYPDTIETKLVNPEEIPGLNINGKEE